MKFLNRQSVRRGQSLIEFALILPLLILFIMVVFDLGRIAFVYSAINNAAREAARYSAVTYGSTLAGAEAAAKELTAGLDQSALTVTRSYPVPERVVVTVTYRFDPVTPIISMLTGSTDNFITLTSQATMYVEN